MFYADLAEVPLWFSSFVQSTHGASLPSSSSFASIPQTRMFLRTKVELWEHVDGSLASLSVHRGFRRFVQAVANSVGLTGYIQRYMHANVRVCMEGTDEQFAAFENFVEQWQKQLMVGDITLVPNHAEEGFFVRRYKGFTIHKSHSRPASVRCRHGVVNGKYSEELSECDKITEYSADSMQSR